MIVCSFLGHETVYDTRAYERLLEAAERIVQENDEVDFWYYRLAMARKSSKDFFNMCCAAVLELKTRHPEKTIHFTRVIWRTLEPDFIASLQRHKTAIPTCLIDKVISPPPFTDPKINEDIVHISENIERWIIRQSDHIISYVYAGFSGLENQLLDAARNGSAVIHDITDSRTAAYITKNANALCGRGLPEDKARQRLKRMALDRLEKLEAKAGTRTVTCSIFSLDEVTYKSLSAFEQAVSYLIENYDAVQFNILSEYCSTGYMLILENLPRNYYSIKLVAITHSPKMQSTTKEEQRRTAQDFCPPGHAMENIETSTEESHAQAPEATMALIDRSDFCICHLTGNPSLQEYMEKTKRTKVLDLGKDFSLQL